MCSTAPKPFVFVLMPFNEEFDDIYKYGIKGAAEDANAYAERVDEQLYDEGILDRIFNQINKADVIVADMTGRNANVFYEVGYAHALGKIVLLLTQNVDDIPFDLKHRPHTVYAGRIQTLREELSQKLIWAISESRREKKQVLERFLVSIDGIEISEDYSYDNVPVITFIERSKILSLTVDIRNSSPEITPEISYIYLFTSPNSKLRPIRLVESEDYGVVGYSPMYAGVPRSRKEAKFLRAINARPLNSSDVLTKQFRLTVFIPPLPPEAVERFNFDLAVSENQEEEYTLLMIRIHSLNNFHDFPFKIKLIKEEDKDQNSEIDVPNSYWQKNLKTSSSKENNHEHPPDALG